MAFKPDPETQSLKMASSGRGRKVSTNVLEKAPGAHFSRI